MLLKSALTMAPGVRLVVLLMARWGVQARGARPLSTLPRVRRAQPLQTALATRPPTQVALRTTMALTAKEQLLARALWAERMRIRARWLLARHPTRPLTLDDLHAVGLVLLWAGILWVVFGTTAFALVVLGVVDAVGDGEAGGVIGTVLGLNTAATVLVGRVCGMEKGMLVLRDIGVSAEGESPFAVTIQKMCVRLSVAKWCSGRGLVEDVEVYGMRGSVGEEGPGASFFLPLWYHLRSVRIHDSQLTVPFLGKDVQLSIFLSELPQFRPEWALVDVFGGGSVHGAVNGSMFTLHKRQLLPTALAYVESHDDSSPWKKVTRLRVDGVELSGGEPFLWARAGSAEIVCDIMVPDQLHGTWRSAAAAWWLQVVLRGLAGEQASGEQAPGEQAPAPSPYIVLDFKLQLSHVRAALARIPLDPSGKPYLGRNELQRVVNYTNHFSEELEAGDMPPVVFRLLVRQEALRGCRLLGGAGLTATLVGETYGELARRAHEMGELAHGGQGGDWDMAQQVVGGLLLVGLGLLN